MAQQTLPTTGDVVALPARRGCDETQAEVIALRGDEPELYKRHHGELQSVVSRRVDLTPELIEDACQQAWIKLLRYQPDRGPTLFGWLVTVAVRDARRLARKDRRNISLDAPRSTSHDGTTTLADHLTSPASIDDSLEARRALRALAALDPRQRRYLALRIAGMSYAEIAATEQVTLKTVDRQLLRARSHLRLAAHQAA